VVQAELVNPVAPGASARQVVRVELGNPAELAARAPRQSKPIVQAVGIRLVIRTWEIRAALRRVAAAVPSVAVAESKLKPVATEEVRAWVAADLVVAAVADAKEEAAGAN